MAARTSRVIGVVAAVGALLLMTVTSGTARAANVSGTGHSSGATSLLGVALGDDEFTLSLVTEESRTSTDPAVDGPGATERVTPLGVASSLVPALSSLSQPTIETHHTSGEDTELTPAIDLATLVAGGAVPGLLAGTVDPVALRSTVGPGGATSSATAAVRDLSLLGGLVAVGLAEAELGSTALTADAGAVRRLQVDEVVALDLGALLASLGISLADLPIDTAIDLLAALGVPLPGDLSAEELAADVADLLTDTSTVRGQVDDLQDDVDDLQADLATLEDDHQAASEALADFEQQLLIAEGLFLACVLLCDALEADMLAAQALVDAAQTTVDDLEAQIDATQAAIDALLDQIDDLLATIADLVAELAGLLDDLLAGLEGAALITLDGVEVRLTARAADTVAKSAAEVEVSIGDIRVGNVSLGGIDVDGTLAELAALEAMLNEAIGAVLSLVDLSLDELVDVQLLAREAAITPEPTGIAAAASFTGLRVTITPPSVCDLLAVLSEVQNPIGAVLDDLGVNLVEVPTVVSDVLGELGVAVNCTEGIGPVTLALTQPLRVEALSLTGAGFFSLPANAEGSATLPRHPGTGGTSQAALAVVLAALGLGAAWLLRRSGGPVARR